VRQFYAMVNRVSLGKPYDTSRIWLLNLGEGFSWDRKQRGSAKQRAE
jgi:hypothetical protein